LNTSLHDIWMRFRRQFPNNAIGFLVLTGESIEEWLKKNTGENFKDYVNRIRIENALPMLLNADMKTYEIAQKVGFGDIRVFNAAFQKIYLETPGSYRKRVRGKE